VPPPEPPGQDEGRPGPPAETPPNHRLKTLEYEDVLDVTPSIRRHKAATRERLEEALREALDLGERALEHALRLDLLAREDEAATGGWRESALSTQFVDELRDLLRALDVAAGTAAWVLDEAEYDAGDEP